MEWTKSIKRVLKKVYYSGNRYYCPNCNTRLRKFISCGTDSLAATEKQIIGAGKRDRECPVCHSAERDRLVYVYVRDYLHLFENQAEINILHIAPEDCLYPAFHQKIKHQHYICGDKFEMGYAYDKRVRYMDITNIDWKADFFDLIICNHVLEHIPDDLQAMRELYRVLKPGGKAILQVPISAVLAQTFEDFSILEPAERERLFGQYNHCRIYGKDFAKRLETAGFLFCPAKINSTEYQKYGFDEREEILVVVKPEKIINNFTKYYCIL